MTIAVTMVVASLRAIIASPVVVSLVVSARRCRRRSPILKHDEAQPHQVA